MFTRIAAVLVATSVIAAPALARTTTVIKSTPAGTVKVIKHNHARYFHGKHVKVVKIVRPHKHHRAHVARNTHVIVKSAKPSGRI